MHASEGVRRLIFECFSMYKYAYATKVSISSLLNISIEWLRLVKREDLCGYIQQGSL